MKKDGTVADGRFILEEGQSISTLTSGRDLMAVGMAPDGNPLLLAADTAWDRSKHDHPGSAPLIVFDMSGEKRAELDARATTTFSQIQPLPDGGWLLASTWPQNGSPNGYVFDASGREVGSLRLGGGIKDLQVSTDGQIWTTYFDEGIYSAAGLGEGLVGFGLDGSVRFRFSALYRHGLPPIDDCYALNVVGESVWAYYYSAFPLVRIEREALGQWWDGVSVHGASAFAVKGNEVVFAGSYEDPRSLYRFSLSSRHVTRMTLRSRDDAEVIPRRAFGRNDRLVVLTDNAIFAATV